MYCVYWIHSVDHTDINSQGYVGITLNFSERMRAHRKNRRKLPLTDAIRKHGWDNLVFDIIQTDMTLEDALSLEKSLRPDNGIGWNSKVGGEIGVTKSWYECEDNALRHSAATSEATKRGIKEKDSPEERSIRAKLNWEVNRESYKDVSKGSNNPRAKLNEDQVREIKYSLIPSGMSNKEISEIFDVKHYVISFIRSGKNWSHI